MLLPATPCRGLPLAAVGCVVCVFVVCGVCAHVLSCVVFCCLYLLWRAWCLCLRTVGYSATVSCAFASVFFWGLGGGPSPSPWPWCVCVFVCVVFRRVLVWVLCGVCVRWACSVCVFVCGLSVQVCAFRGMSHLFLFMLSADMVPVKG